ncbi:unnamed protein product [Caenorhabditis bovis]|uniref:DUF8117 domain-containing protein n=1 Tax=Caenorhabditis bovis TaxID=2654633 RepID=A0A8S1ECT2_9PELO|nr:unnamed protein product [Caenorhabditis bovis]
MTLPVSMDDKELFPKDEILNVNFSMKTEIDGDIFRQMFNSLDRLWWSRLVISVRGYVINYVQQNDDVLFPCDDAFIQIHQKVADKSSDEKTAYEYLEAIYNIIRSKDLLLSALSNPAILNRSSSFDRIAQSFVIIYGEFNGKLLQLVIAQLPAFTLFIKVVVNLQQRWVNQKTGKKSIRFETDPEWEPDERVVLFQQFGTDNRTWVLLDFDRHIIEQWKPTGTSVIFGDRFVEKKKRAGMKLCSTCGMIEQKVAQFAQFNGDVFCSKECFDEATSKKPNYHGATVLKL